MLPYCQEASTLANRDTLFLCLKQHTQAMFLPHLRPYRSQEIMTCSRDEHACFFFLFHCCCAVQFQCRHARSTLHESCVMVSEAASCEFYICACDLNSLVGAGASTRGRARSIRFEISAVLAVCSTVILRRHNRQCVMHMLRLCVKNGQTW